MAYNKGLTLSMNLVVTTNPDGSLSSHLYDDSPPPQGDGPYTYPEDPGYPKVPPTSWRTAAIAKTGIPSIHHSLADSNDELTKPILLNDLKTATIFFADTHGSGSTFAATEAPTALA